MRAKKTTTLQDTCISATAIDLESDVFYVVSEKRDVQNATGQISFEVWKVEMNASGEDVHVYLFSRFSRASLTVVSEFIAFVIDDIYSCG